MYDILHMPQLINIGYTGEHEFTTIEINLSGWLNDLPEEERDSYVPSIVHIRPGESLGDAYIVSTSYENGILTWEVQASDIGTHEGTGLAQVWLEEQTNNTLNKLGMSTVFATLARQSVSDGNPDIPDPQVPWLQQMTALKTEAVNAKTSAEAARIAAEEAEETTEKWVTGGSGGTPSATNNAKAYALKAEGWAVGTQDGEPVESGEDYYHDNAKYYAEQAADSSSDAEDSASAAAQSASDADGYADTASGYATAAGNAQTAAETAQGKSEDAQAAAELAQSKAEGAAEAAAQAVQDAIDDTAGDGDTDKLWSADKVYNELAKVATKDYVDDKISAFQQLMELIVTANREDSMVASKAYDTGDLMIVDSTLYKASTSIANGATLTVGTNVTETTVAAEIAALS